jgi:hypothetical protein
MPVPAHVIVAAYAVCPAPAQVADGSRRSPLSVTATSGSALWLST